MARWKLQPAYEGKVHQGCLNCPHVERIAPMDMARADPDHNWRVTLYAPLRGRVYQRHGEGKWVLIDSDLGFV